MMKKVTLITLFVIIAILFPVVLGRGEASNGYDLGKIHFYCFYNENKAYDSVEAIKEEIEKIKRTASGNTSDNLEITVGFECNVFEEAEYRSLSEELSKAKTASEEQTIRTKRNEYLKSFYKEVVKKGLETIDLSVARAVSTIGYTSNAVLKVKASDLDYLWLIRMTGNAKVSGISVSFEKKAESDEVDGELDNSFEKLHFYCFYNENKAYDSVGAIKEEITNIQHYSSDNNPDELVEVTIEFKRSVFDRAEYISLTEELSKAKTASEKQTIKTKRNEFLKEFYEDVVKKGLETIDLSVVKQADPIGYAPFAVLKVKKTELDYLWLAGLCENKTIANISVSFEKKAESDESYLTPDEWMYYTKIDRAQIYEELTGAGVKIGVYESGGVCNTANTALQGIDVTIASGENITTDHATQVTAIVYAAAPAAEYYIKSVSEVGVEWFINQGCDLVNCSFSYYSNEYDPVSGTYQKGPREYRYDIDAVFDHQAKDSGIVIVGSSGNQNNNVYSPKYNPDHECASPAHAFNVITVGGVKVSENNTIVHAPGACYVSDMPYIKPLISAMYYVNVAGSNVGGTSFSAPQVAGGVALMMEADPGYKHNPQRVMSALAATAGKPADYFDNLGFFNNKEGAGLANIYQSADIGARYDFVNTNTSAATVIQVKTLFLSSGEKMTAGLAWDVTANHSPDYLRVTNYDLKLYNNASLTGTPLVATNTINTNLERIEFTASQSGYYYLVVYQTGAMYLPDTSDKLSLSIWER